MAQFFKAKPSRSNKLSAKLSLSVTQLDHLGAGIAQHQGKVVFVPGALPGETVTAQLTEQKKRFAKAKLIKIDKPASSRIEPECEYYGRCGGCDLQHMSLHSQREHKQVALQELMFKACTIDKTSKVAKTEFSGKASISVKSQTKAQVKPVINTQTHAQGFESAQPLSGEAWGYRRRARLATHFDKKTKVLELGFRAASSSQVVAVKHCKVLAPDLSLLIAPVGEVLNRLSSKRALGHVELTQADNARFVVIRVVNKLLDADIALLAEFALHHSVSVLMQDDNGHCVNVDPENRLLPQYLLSNGIKLDFSPGNFIQVNGGINLAMVDQAVDWLAPKSSDRILDLFCGMGNFSLALAKTGAQVVGVEGVPEMVEQAKYNARQNNLSNVEFFHADLSSDVSEAPWMQSVDKLLLDPARAGAFEVLHLLDTMEPEVVVYVSCNPASLSRDASVLFEKGYSLSRFGLIDMFPQTHHIEAMAMFVK